MKMDLAITEVSTVETFSNLSISELISKSLSAKEGELAQNQSLVVRTGQRTGRSPKDRFIVRDEITEQAVAWNAINQPIASEKFDQLWEKANEYLQSLPARYEALLSVGAHRHYGVTVKVITELAWQSLFANVLFIRTPQQKQSDNAAAWTILSVPGFKTDPTIDGVHSDAAVILNFSQRKILICGTYYAGEIKKAMFSVLNFLLPPHDILPMHCAANADHDGNTALFFGLSGTGKTTLSADPKRLLIGDDEHGWGPDGIFNFEGGCYAKCIDLSQEKEPLIWNAIRYGAVLENVVIDPQTKIPNYNDGSITQNTRAAYPREYIPNRVDNNAGKQPSAILFLTCDLFGVLPPVAKLTVEQAAYYFLSGYTALVGSTEVGGGSGIKPTFSACFGAPFFPRAAHVYAELLMKRLRLHPTEVFLVNTGWTGGAHGEGGQRFSIPTTRQIVSAILNGELKNAAYDNYAGFNLQIPRTVKGIEQQLLNPQHAWSDKGAFDKSKRKLIELFIENFKKFDKVSKPIVDAGPVMG